MMKVGDQLTIRKRLNPYELYSMNDWTAQLFPNPGMVKYSGCAATVVGVDPDGYYKLDVDNREWSWVDGMFE